jgi:tetratricopeptide (TPR) repeat protein
MQSTDRAHVPVAKLPGLPQALLIRIGAVLAEALRMKTWGEVVALVDAYPFLTEPAAITFLDSLLSSTHSHGDPCTGEHLVQMRSLLEWCRDRQSEPPLPLTSTIPLCGPSPGIRLLESSSAVIDAATQTRTLDTPAELDRFIECWERIIADEAFSSMPVDWQSDGFNAAAIGLTSRLFVNQAAVDEHAALGYLRRAIRISRRTSPNHSKYLHNLAGLFANRARRLGSLSDLDKAIRASKLAVANSREDPWYGTFALYLGQQLRERYEWTGAIRDLQNAVSALDRALTPVNPPGDVGASIMNQLASALRLRYLRQGNARDLFRAVDLARQSVQLTAPQSFYLAGRLTNLGNSLLENWRITRAETDLDEVIATHQRAALLSTPDDFQYASRLNNWGNSLANRFEATRRVDDLDAAIALYREAIATSLTNSPLLASRYFNLGNGLMSRYMLAQRSDDRAEAANAYRQACQQGLERAPEWCLAAARAWGDWALANEWWTEACIAYDPGVQAISHLVAAQIMRASRETWLVDAEGVLPNAAYAWARAGELKRAVELVEEGRARLLGEALERDRRDLDRLAELGQGRLLSDYRATIREWERLVAQMGQSESAETGSEMQTRLDGCHARLNDVAEKIRKVPGYEGFLKALDFHQVCAQAALCPLVYIVASLAGGLALIVRHVQDVKDATSVEPVWLPHLTQQALRDKLQGPEGTKNLAGYLGAYANRLAGDKAAATHWRQALDETTHWLWDSAMGPIVHSLMAPEPSRHGNRALTVAQAILIPTGLLGVLPLHAAWRLDDTAPSGRRYALDEVAWRYAPSARALAAMQGRSRDPGDDSLLLVVDPQPVGREPLLSASAEAKAVSAHWPASRRISRWYRTATHAEIKSLLAQYSFFHFAGHAFAGWNEPRKGGLLLAGGEVLSVQEIQSMNLAMRLAVLSACETGVPGTRLADEVIGLPAALVEAGVAGVVASLWSVPDTTTAQLMADFYDLWRDPRAPLETGEALRRAQIALRDAGHYHPYYWAAFTYHGV